MKAAAIIVAAGSGTRYGSEVRKQFMKLGPWPVWRWSYEALRRHPAVNEVLVVIPSDDPSILNVEGVQTTIGGDTRTQSVLNGLKALSSLPETPVLIHDAARPGLTSDIIDALLLALEDADAAAPALPINDALKRGDGTLKTVDRSDLRGVQTPQAFKVGKIIHALEATGESLVDDLEAIERTGGKGVLIRGDMRLSKITHPGDLQWMEQVLMGGEIRTGSGFDVHAFEPGTAVTLCGIDIPHTAKLKGHSDADAAWHALTDAILGALALGDIGDHFPPAEARWKDAPSSLFLEFAGKLANDRGYQISNADITVIAEAPQVKPHRDAMRQATATCLGISLDRVSVKATTTEGLGFTGRREGIAAQASVTLTKTTPATR